MADPTKEPQELKKGELSADELDAVTGGAVDAYNYFGDTSTLGKAITRIGLRSRL